MAKQINVRNSTNTAWDNLLKDANIEITNSNGRFTSSYLDGALDEIKIKLDAATNINTVNTIVSRDASGNFSAGTITATLSGNATTASSLKTARTITLAGAVTGSGSFNGSADITINTAVNHTHATLSQGNGITSFSYNGGSAATIAVDYATVVGTTLGTASVGISTKVAREDHVHPTTGLMTTSHSANSITGFGTTTAALAAAAAAGTATTISRSDHVHPTTGLMLITHAANSISGFGGDGSATTISRSDHTHAYAPTLHASTTTTYGVADTSNYGHVKIGDGIATSSGLISIDVGDGVILSGVSPNQKLIVDVDGTSLQLSGTSPNKKVAVLYSATVPSALGTASAGTANTPARIDHVHPTTGLMTTAHASNSITGFGTTAAALAAAAAAGTATTVSRSDHVHATTGLMTTSHSANSITGFGTTTAALAAAAAAGTATTVSRSDHVHTTTGLMLTTHAANSITGFGGDGSATTISRSDHTHSGIYAETLAASYNLPATVGWYRIAESAVGIARNSGIFNIEWTVSGAHGRVLFTAGCYYGNDNGTGINQISYNNYSTTTGLSKARVVYHTTYSGNYAYLEVYSKSANALNLVVTCIDPLGWTLNTTSSQGGIPTGYTYKEVTFDQGLVTSGQITTTVETGTSPFNISSTTLVPNLNVEMVGGVNLAGLMQTSHVANGITALGGTSQALGTASNGSGTIVALSNHVHPTTGLMTTSHSANSITGFGATTAALAAAAAAGTATTVSRSDHVHATTGLMLTSHASNSITGFGGDGSATTISRSDHTHSYAPISHTSTTTTYGAADIFNYGHVKIGDGIAISSGVISIDVGDGVILSGTSPNQKLIVDVDGTSLQLSGTSPNKKVAVLYSATVPSALGTASAGTANTPARIDHVHPTTGLMTTAHASNSITGFGTTTAALAAAAAAGTATTVSRSDHVHATTGLITTSNIGSQSVSYATTAGSATSATSATTATTANNIPTSDVGGNIWVATAAGTEGITSNVVFGVSTAPSSPQTNQIWFDSANRVVKMWNGSAWVTF